MRPGRRGRGGPVSALHTTDLGCSNCLRYSDARIAQTGAYSVDGLEDLGSFGEDVFGDLPRR